MDLNLPDEQWHIINAVWFQQWLDYVQIHGWVRCTVPDCKKGSPIFVPFSAAARCRAGLVGLCGPVGLAVLGAGRRRVQSRTRSCSLRTARPSRTSRSSSTTVASTRPCGRCCRNSTAAACEWPGPRQLCTAQLRCPDALTHPVSSRVCSLPAEPAQHDVWGCPLSVCSMDRRDVAFTLRPPTTCQDDTSPGMLSGC